MTKIEGRRALVTGGSRGIGLGIAEALVASGANVTIVARDKDRLTDVKSRLAVTTHSADVTDEGVARSLLAEIKPDILVLSAAIDPGLGPIHEMSWEDFSRTWEVDVKAAFFWIRNALKQPLAPGSRVIVMSSGAAVGGSPLSGGYAGAKRMLWFLARYANSVSADLGRGIHFQAAVPMQILDSGQGVAASAAYAKKAGVTREAFLARFGMPLTPRAVGDHVITMLTDPKHSDAAVRGIKGDVGLVPLEG